MKKKTLIIATIKSWNIENAKRFILEKRDYRVHLLTDWNKLRCKKIRDLNPKYIFFPHWSWMIPKEIYENFECIVFHMTDLPFGRGGSPLQNLIVRGIQRAKLSAIRVVKELDAGPVYLKRDFSLHGSAQEIYKRVSHIIFDNMIPFIIENRPSPIPQKGRTVVFKRRSPQESKIPSGIDLEGAYDYIRMLDAEGYPPAFIETRRLRLEFNGASKKDGCIDAKVRIKKKGKKQ